MGTPPAADRDRDRDRLRRARVTLARNGNSHPCEGDHRYTDESPAVRAEVLERCHDCLIVAACRAAGRHEQHGVWGGIDRTRKAPMPTWGRP